jgi:DNA-binding transcriptional MerR regulator
VADLPDTKLYYKIGEVAALLELKTHVLRYWESEFPQLKPVKSRSNQRLYRRADVETALMIKDLLYRQGFTIAGALQQLKSTTQASLPLEPPLSEAAVLRELRTELVRLRNRLAEDSSS